LNPGDNVENLLDQYVNNIVVGGSVSIPENIGPDISTTITFTWNAIDSSQNPLQTEDLLIMGLPHHFDCIDRSALKYFDLIPAVFLSIKGPMRGFVGSSWKLKESLTDLQWFSRFPINPLKIEAIINQLKQDVNMLPLDTDTYGYGKFVASYARLILIAEQLGVSDLIPFMLNRLELFLGPWLYRVYYRDTFLYDTTWGGAISANGWLYNASDYGNGIYNDHHFHNGYYIYAGAVIVKYDRNWEWAPFLMELVRDIANPSIADPFYPITRHKDWFVGHSWAQGLDPTYDGKNQESSSEAVNAYYALVLYGIAINNDLVKNVGRVLLATEIRSSHKYWQTVPDSPYPPIFAANAVVGIVWQLKLDHATFFSSDIVHIHCIQMIPFTPISEDLLPASWVKLQYPIIAPRLPFVIPEWQAYIILNLAIIDPEAAWDLIQKLPHDAFGKGNSRTASYWWVATRP
jgi:endo-1,3(4)-beta-glucanase